MDAHRMIRRETMERFLRVATTPRMASLVTFHAEHKLLLLAYNETGYRSCGRIVANHGRLPVTRVLEDYGRELNELLKTPFARQSMVNSLQHGYGWLANKLDAADRKTLLQAIEAYRNRQISLQTVTTLLRQQALHHCHSYLLSQQLLHLCLQHGQPVDPLTPGGCRAAQVSG